MGLKFAKIKDENGNTRVKSPERAGAKEAGIEFYVPNDFGELTLKHGDSAVIPLGIKVRLPNVPESLKDTHQYMLELKNKSGVASKKGLFVGACVIDTTYQGELFVNVHHGTDRLYKNFTPYELDLDNSDPEPIYDTHFNHKIVIKGGDNIVQGVLILVNTEGVIEMDEDRLYDEVSQRGDQGFGSNYREE